MRPGSVPLDEPLVAQMMAWGAEAVPALAAARPIEALVGVRPIPAGGLPCVGNVPGIPGYVEAVTHSGVTLAPLIARSLVDEMLGEPGNPLLAPFRPDRYPPRLTGTLPALAVEEGNHRFQKGIAGVAV